MDPVNKIYYIVDTSILSKTKITFHSILLSIFTYVELFTLIKFNYLVSFCYNNYQYLLSAVLLSNT